MKQTEHVQTVRASRAVAGKMRFMAVETGQIMILPSMILPCLIRQTHFLQLHDTGKYR